MPTPRDLPAIPSEDDPTEDVPVYDRLHRKYAAPLPSESSIEDDVAAEGIEDKDPFEEFPHVPEVMEVVEPAEAEAFAELPVHALLPADEG